MGTFQVKGKVKLSITDVTKGNEVNDKMHRAKLVLHGNPIPFIIRKSIGCGVNRLELFLGEETDVEMDIVGFEQYLKSPFKNNYIGVWIILPMWHVRILAYIKKENVGTIVSAFL